MHELLQNPVNAWLLAGAFLIAFEALTAPGIGLFLGGLGALGVALLLEGGLIPHASTGAQFAWCFGLTILWTAILWRPLQKFRLSRDAQKTLPSNNLVGQTALVAAGGLIAGERGQVIWSGTVMNALLEAPPGLLLAEGAKVHIFDVSGNTLKVSVKQGDM